MFRRKYAGEELYLGTLAEDVHLEEAIVKTVLEECDIKLITIKSAEYVKVPGPDYLEKLLLGDGFQPQLLEPLRARVREGSEPQWITLKWLEHPFIESDGAVTFKATWSGRRAPSKIAATDLNEAAKYYVCVCYFAISHFDVAG